MPYARKHVGLSLTVDVQLQLRVENGTSPLGWLSPDPGSLRRHAARLTAILGPLNAGPLRTGTFAAISRPRPLDTLGGTGAIRSAAARFLNLKGFGTLAAFGFRQTIQRTTTMSDLKQIQAVARDRAGKGAAR